MNLILAIITILSVIMMLLSLLSKKQMDTEIQEENKRQYAERDRIKLEIDTLSREKTTLVTEKTVLDGMVNREKTNLDDIKKDIAEKHEESKRILDENAKLSRKMAEEQAEFSRRAALEQERISKQILNSQQTFSSKAFENYCDVLDNQYKEYENEYQENLEMLNQSYSNIQSKLMAETENIKQDLEKIKATRDAAVEAARREKEIEDNLSFYCLDISDADKSDIARLEALKPSLNKPRVLSMLIWQTWFQKPLKALSANIIGEDDKTGIYKITNIKTKECYIGQAVGVKVRWTSHVKNGLGIDTPAGNKLYSAMQDYGVWNFSFELLEECPKEQLNEKEKYYINLYNSYQYGYNSNSGIGDSLI